MAQGVEFEQDPLESLYDCCPHHELIIELFTKTVRRELLRSALSIPPQHGKTTICAQYGLAWYAGHHPEHKIIYGTYNDSRAGIVGESVRNIMNSERHKDVFPDFEMRKGSKSKDFVGFGLSGSIMFLGRNSGASGNPCDLFVIDDPFKDMREAKSETIRNEVWTWYCSVVEARCPIQTPIFIIHTRWSDDDLIGRLCDKTHPRYNKDDNDEFEYLNIPAIVDDINLAAALKMEPGGALWPGKPDNPKWPLALLQRIQRNNPVTFSALFMGNPVPPDGDFFNKAMIRDYRGPMPANVRKYGASDHAVSVARRADKTVLGIAGLDTQGELWISRDLKWAQMPSDVQVEEMAQMIKRHEPLTWWSEGDHIKKAIGPFLKIRMRALRLYRTIIKELPKDGDKQQKAQSIRAMMAMGMVHLPADAPWYGEAVAQLLRFDGSEGRPDDFVDFLANLGRGIDKMMPAGQPAGAAEKGPVTGTAGWVKMMSKQDRAAARAIKSLQGW